MITLDAYGQNLPVPNFNKTHKTNRVYIAWDVIYNHIVVWT